MVTCLTLDGGLATTLQRHGLPAFSPVEPWVTDRPDAVLDAHRAFVAAGAQVLLTATFRCLPSERSDWAVVGARAVELARTAAGGDAAVWLSLGPGDGHAQVVAALGDRVDGVVLETFTDESALVTAVRAVRGVWAGPLVGCLVPSPRRDPRAAAAALLAVGATGVGFNCGAAAHVVAAARAVPADVPLWAKPNDVGPATPELAELAARCAWLGGCCGTGPEGVAACRAAAVSR